MKRRTCPNCGEDNNASDLHCWNCGHSFSGSVPSSSGATHHTSYSIPKPTSVPQIKCDSCGTANSSLSRYCSNCGNELQTLENIQSLYNKHLEKLTDQVNSLSNAILDIESSVREIKSKQRYEGSKLPESSLFSHSLAHRALTVYGHLIVAQFLIGIPLAILAIILDLI
jgi:predicted amidophosphoribosyltransferase